LPVGIESTSAIVLALDRPGPVARPALLRPGGISLLNRALRTAALAGIGRATVLTSGSPEAFRQGLLASPSPRIDLSWIQAPPGASDREALSLVPPTGGPRLILRAEWIHDVRLLSGLLRRTPPVVLSDRGRIVPSGLCLVDERSLARMVATGEGPGDLAGMLDALLRASAASVLEIDDLPAYLPELRKHQRPLLFPVRTEEEARSGLGLLLAGAQKGTLDLPARYLHPPLENRIVRCLCGAGGLVPTHVTAFTALLAFLAAGMMMHGHLAAGILCAFAVGVLDGVDGKLARVKLMCTRLGGTLENCVDGLYEVAWYLALAHHLNRDGTDPGALVVGTCLSLFYLLDRAVTGVFRRLAGVELFDYAPFDRFFRGIGARRNTNVLLLMAGIAAGSPGFALRVVCVWTVVTFGVHLVRAVRHLRVGMPLAPARVR
jgi:phosphatidylglycerophosphate synthase